MNKIIPIFEKELSRNCNDCKLAIFEDHGYSNYTVEGTYFYCGKFLNPNGKFDRFYGLEEKLRYAEQCPSFEEGDSIHLCVEESVDDLEKEQQDYFNSVMERV